MSSKILIIGAGIAGLSAGCYGQMNGYKTEIYEMNPSSGGLCTSWKRNGYLIDGCMTFLTGTNNQSQFYRVWSELGAVQDRRFVHHNEVCRIKRNGKEFILYSDLNKLEKHLLEIAPEDQKLIMDLLSDMRKLSNFNPPIDKSNLRENIKNIFGILPYMNIFKKYNMTLEEYANKYENSFLRSVLPMTYDLPNFPAIFAIISIVRHSKGDSGFPIGGSLEFAKSIEKRYLGLGGKIIFNAKIEKIIVESNKAIGIRLSDGTEQYADKIISASDGYTTIFKMLEGNYINPKIQSVYTNIKPVLPLIRVHLGVREDFSVYPHTLLFDLDNPINIAGEDRNYIGVTHYCFDKTFSPEGKSLLRVSFTSNYEYWEKLYDNYERYKKEKETIALMVINELDKQFGGVKEKVEMIDVTTPITYKRYTNNWQGSYMGWEMTPQTVLLKVDKILPRLRNFYMAGHWSEGYGGLLPAAISGRDVMKMVSKEDKKRFITSMKGSWLLEGNTDDINL